MMRMKQRSLAVQVGLVGLACAVAAACGSKQPTSFVDPNSSGGGPGHGDDNGGDPGIDLNIGGGSIPVGGDGSAIGAGGAGCGFTSFVADPPLVNVLLVVDKSLSMMDKPTGFTSDKWTALRGALDATFAQTKSKISFGLDLFPYSGTSGQALTDTCEMPTGAAVVVPVQAGTKTAPLILAALDNNPPDGGTPTAAALTRAYGYFTTGAGKSLEGEKYVLLATDGGPNCNGDLSCTAATCTACLDHPDHCPSNQNLCDPKIDKLGPTNCLDQDASVSAVAQLTKAGIKTIVVGIPGTEAYTNTLDALAQKSGVVNPDAPPSYFAVSAASGVTGLSDTLAHITTGLVKSCELHLKTAPPDLTKLFVVVDGVELARDPADGNGWTIPDASISPPVIEITGKTCDQLKTQGAEYINVTYGCPNYDPPK